MPGFAQDDINHPYYNEPRGKYYLLVIAVDHYRPGLDVLYNPVRDANRLVNILTSQYKFNTTEDYVPDDLRTDPRYSDESRYSEKIGVYNDDFITTLYNEAFTDDAVNRVLERIAARIGPDDALLVYYAGHGVKRNTGYFITGLHPYENGQNKEYAIETLFRAFQKFDGQRIQCRDFLLILDCCYAGSVGFGFGREWVQKFSRMVLTSCRVDQLAAEGEYLKGSPFSNALIRFLEENGSPFLLFNEIDRQNLHSIFLQIRQEQEYTQDIVIKNLPDADYGSSHFLFERREKLKPKLDHLQASFVQNLDFEQQKGAFNDHYIADKNKLNFITTRGENAAVQNVLLKAIINILVNDDKTMKIEDWSVQLSLSPGAFGVTDVWLAMATTLAIPVEARPQMVDWFIDQLRGIEYDNDDNELKRKVNSIFNINLAQATTDVLEKLYEFCREFGELFHDRYEQLSGEDKAVIGKLFIVITEQRSSFTGVPQPIPIDLQNNSDPRFNFIVTPAISDLNQKHVSEWLKALLAKSQTQSIVELTARDVLQQKLGVDNPASFKIKLVHFIDKICDHCALTEKERSILTTWLYQFNNNSFT